VAILRLQREMFVVGAELATAPENRSRLTDGVSRVTPAMVEALERAIDAVAEEAGVPGEFVVPGGTPASAALDHARSVIRRAERRAVALGRETEVEDSHVIPYLNRSADYVYMLARAVEAVWTPTREE
jgi:cob(I)alamin adenosyltransferase